MMTESRRDRATAIAAAVLRAIARALVRGAAYLGPLYKTKQFGEAVRVARDWSTRDAASIRARILLGDALLATGDRDGARNTYEAALDLANAVSSNERPTAILERLDRLRARTPARR